MRCECLSRMKKGLEPLGLELTNVAVVFPRNKDGTHTRAFSTVYLPTQFIGKKPRGQKAAPVYPSYCPFCGQPIDAEEGDKVSYDAADAKEAA